MLTSAAAPSPNAAPAGATESPSPPVSDETRAANAADFFALLGNDKAAGKKLAKVKPTSLPATVKLTNATAIVANGKTDTKATPADAAKSVLPSKVALKTAGDIKIEAENGKAQAVTALPAAILEALAAGAKVKDAVPVIENTAALSEAAPDEPIKIKGKPARPPSRREGEGAVKSDASPRATDAAADASRIAKAETHTAIVPVTAKPAQSEAAAATFTPAPSSDPLSQPLVGNTQITDARIPLAAREAAQAGYAAPVLAMRTITKDGVTKSIEIRLDPAELGQVDVKLETGHDGKLQAVVSAQNADAFELLKKDSGALEAALREAGVDLGEGGITFALNDSGADQSQQREAAYGGTAARRNASAAELAAAAAVEASSWRNGVIDISV